MLDLTKLPAFYLAKYGREKLSEVCGEGVPIIAMWEKRAKFPLTAVQKLLEFDPAPLGEITPLYTNPEPGKKLAILVPLAGPPAPKMMDSLMLLYDKKEMAYKRVSFNCLSVARNTLAAWALRGPYDWFFWMDGDAMLPAGDAEWFKRAAELPAMPDVFANLHTIYRLLVHNKTVVSCCYVGRQEGAAPQFGGGETVDSRQEVRRGPRDSLKEVSWVGFHGVLTHRSVFDDIVKTQGDEIRMKNGGIGSRFSYEYCFFDPLDRETPADDVPFSRRATRAGHKLYVDMAVQAAHVGDRPFSYKDA